MSMQPDDITTHVRTAAPTAPTDLRERCLTAKSRDAMQLVDETRRAGRSRTFLGRASALAAAAAVTVSLVLALGGEDQPAAGPILDGAIAAFEDIDAIHVVNEAVGGEESGGFVADHWRVVDLGWREEMSFGNVKLYSAALGKEATYVAHQDAMHIADVPEFSLHSEYQDHAERSIKTLQAMARRDGSSVRVSPITRDGVLRHRLSAVEENGFDLAVEIEVVSGRLVRIEKWLDTSPAAVHMTSHYSYPDPRDVDPALFDPYAIGAKHVVEVNDFEKLRLECMWKMRLLVTYAAMYAAEHDERLPRSLDVLEQWVGDRAKLDEHLRIDVPGEAEPSVIESFLEQYDADVTLYDLDPSAVIFWCQFGDQYVVACADGHVEVQAERPSVD